MTSYIDGKGPIFVTNADGDKGYAITQRMLQFPSKYPHLPRYPVYAGLPDASTSRATSLKEQGATVRAFDIFNDHKSAVDALRDVIKLCLVVDPLSERISRANAFQYAKAFIDAAKEAKVNHIIFLTPFSPLDPVSPPSSPFRDPAMCISLADPSTYRSQYMMIETYLRTQCDNCTILRYPGILYEHLRVFRKYIFENNAFPVSDQHLEFAIESSSMADIAQGTACIAYAPTTRHRSNVYKLTGPQLLTLEEVSTRVLTCLQRDDAELNLIDLNALEQILYESIGNKEHVAFLLEVWGLQQKSMAGGRFEITRDLEALTGQSGKTLNEYFEDDNVQDVFRSPMPTPFVA
ncbi:hypothetical protein BDA99DRAFT_539306 [Phascolomyces articulosus]|uniref:NmrA-like domain-containing protein n=1 Tax=Phascolomyces articulosus TaxID=60185 RepID=A0AAD5K6I3_9FUNG|nr:hypothetical protein BDA99DRAFT_539306 [Phascolomyces articulosus]